MSRIEGIPDKKANVVTRLIYGFAKRKLKKVPEPLRVVAHHGWLAMGYGSYEMALDRSRLVKARLKTLAGIKAATLVGCPF